LLNDLLSAENNKAGSLRMKLKTGATLLLFAIALTGCSKKSDYEAKSIAPPPTLVTTANAQTRSLEIREETVGSLEGLIDPTVSAEVPARVVDVLAHAGDSVNSGQLIAVLDAEDIALQRREAKAEIGRLRALLANQGKVVERNQRLVKQNFISQNALDDVTTQEDALRQQLEAAEARLAGIEHNSSKTRILSPLDGRVETQIVSVGDYVKVGDPLFRIISTKRLRAHLPFPEGVSGKLKPGQTVRLSTPTAPDDVVTTTIRDIKPLIGSNNRAADVIADVVGREDWHPGASVNGAVVLGERPQAVVVPEASVVLRPAGEVVYVIQDNTAQQRIVKSGLRDDGMVEIVEGLASGEVVAVDGAGYLTDKAKVNVQAAKDVSR
jgi:RND family efflux transporter MFP subunit